MASASCPHCGSVNPEGAPTCLHCGRSLGELSRGVIVDGRYEITATLGQGGMGVVYKARDLRLDETVALKMLRADVSAHPDLSRRFRNEIKLARRVAHRNVCRVFEYGETQGLRYIAMEYVDGIDLRELMRRQRRFSTEDAFEFAVQASAGLGAIHEAGIVHRDLKMRNIMRDNKGVIRLMDFGIAKSAWGEPTLGATGTGTIIGTPEYMSPEQGRGGKVDARSDVYSMGIVIFELFTGNVPFRADTPVAVIFMHIDTPPPLEAPQAAAIPAPLIPVIRKALAKDPAKRYRTADDLGEALWQARVAVFPRLVDISLARSRWSPPPLTPTATIYAEDHPTGSTTEIHSDASTTPAIGASDGHDAVAPRAWRIPPHQTLSVESRSPTERRDAGARRSATAVWIRSATAVLAFVVFGLLAAYVSLKWRSNQGTTGDERSSAQMATATPESSPIEASRPTMKPTDRKLGTPVVASSNSRDTSTTRSTSKAADATPTPRRERVSRPVLTLGPAFPAETRIPPTPTPSPMTDTGIKSSTVSVSLESSAKSVEKAVGTLILRVKPWANVEIDGREAGTTPIAPLVISAGAHEVILSHPDYRSLTKSVRIAPGKTTRVIIDLADEAFPLKRK